MCAGNPLITHDKMQATWTRVAKARHRRCQYKRLRTRSDAIRIVAILIEATAMQAEFFREYLVLVVEGVGLLVGLPAVVFCVSAHKELREKGWRAVLGEFFIG